MRFILIVVIFFASVTAHAATKPRVDRVLIDKSGRALSLMVGNRVIAKFPIVLGGNPIGHKRKEGDERTPEGSYVLDYKKTDSAFFRSIHISYPNASDRQSAKDRGVEPGGAIMIHGQKNGLGWLSFLSQHYDWTNGCIALSNEDMQRVWDLVQVPVPIEITP